MTQLIWTGEIGKVFLGAPGAPTDITIEVGEVEFGGGDRSVDMRGAMGGGNIFIKRPQEAFTANLKLVVEDVKQIQYVLGAETGADPYTTTGDTARPSGHTFGVLFAEDGDFAASANRFQIRMDNIWGVAITGQSITADGYMQVEIIFTCLPEDYSQKWASAQTWAVLQ